MKPLRDQHVKPKTAATFKCELYKDTPNFKWFKGDDEIPIEPTDKTEIKKDGKELALTVKNAAPDDVGEYSIEVEGRRYAAKLTLGGLCASVTGAFFSKVASFKIKKCRNDNNEGVEEVVEQ